MRDGAAPREDAALAAAIDAYDAGVGSEMIAILADCGGDPAPVELGLDYRVVVDIGGTAGVVAVSVTAPDGSGIEECVTARLAELELATPPPRITGMSFSAGITTRGTRRIETRSRLESASGSVD